VKQTGILMIDEMRDKALADLKTQTRRVIIPQPSVVDQHGAWQGRNPRSLMSCPYGRSGDRLYLKENHRLSKKRIEGKLCIVAEYRFNYEDTGFRQYKWEDLDKATRRKLSKIKTWGRWRSKLFMYKFLARVWFTITDVRVERVQDISPDDARAEGIKEHCDGGCEPHCNACNEIDKYTYRRLWDSINAERGHSWAANPWVWVITFSRLKDAA
jgi:hypothetical protein